MALTRIVIQQDMTTGRFHPAWYKWAPFPGPGPHDVERFKSGGHHTIGFDNAEEAQASARKIAEHFEVEIPEDGFEIRRLDEAGADVLIERAA